MNIITKHRIVDKLKVKDISFKYSMHRNTVRNIMTLYSNSASNSLRDKIQNEKHIDSDELNKICSFLLSKSRKPLSQPKQATIEEEKEIINNYNLLKIWAKRLKITMEKRRMEWYFSW